MKTEHDDHSLLLSAIVSGRANILGAGDGDKRTLICVHPFGNNNLHLAFELDALGCPILGASTRTALAATAPKDPSDADA
jgi:hypothetical protein